MLNDNSHMLLCCHLAPAAAAPDCGGDSSYRKPRPPLLAGKDDQMQSDKRRMAKRNRSYQHVETLSPARKSIPDELGCCRNTGVVTGAVFSRLLEFVLGALVKCIVGYPGVSNPPVSRQMNS